jgi:hypothetical protein
VVKRNWILYPHTCALSPFFFFPLPNLLRALHLHIHVSVTFFLKKIRGTCYVYDMYLLLLLWILIFVWPVLNNFLC